MFQPVHAEALAARALYSLDFGERGFQLGMTRIILEIDTTELVRDSLQWILTRVDWGLFKQIIHLISASFDYCAIRHYPRNCNKMVDCLAIHGASVVRSSSAVFMSQVPKPPDKPAQAVLL